MITLAASMFDMSGMASSAVQLGETLFLVIGVLVVMIGAYGLARRRA